MFEARFQVSIYYAILFIVVLFTSFCVIYYPRNFKSCVPYNDLRTKILFFFCVIFIGFRKWSAEDIFGDSIRYGEAYLSSSSFDFSASNDIGFNFFTTVCHNLNIPITLYFIILAFLYTFPLYLFSKTISKNKSYIVLLIIVTSFQFYNYGVNGIRNGISTSFLLLAYVNYLNKKKMAIYIMIALSFHISALLPIIAFVLSSYYKNVKFYFLLWLISIPLSFKVSSFILDLINFDFINKRNASYLSTDSALDIFSNTGFRWDFLLFSSVPVFMGAYFIFRKKFQDNFYCLMMSTYLFSNAFWILINEVNFSNRFAFLSWFIMPILLIYPFIKINYINYRALATSLIILLNFIFTYFMYLK